MQPPASYCALLQTLSYFQHTLVYIIDYNGLINIFSVCLSVCLSRQTDRWV